MDHVNLIDLESSMHSDSSECPVCLECSVETMTIKTVCCKHVMCFKCYMQWRLKQNTCPLCRSIHEDIPINKETVIAIPQARQRDDHRPRNTSIIIGTFTLLMIVTTAMITKGGACN